MARVFCDELPSVKVSRLRALGEITAESAATVVRLGDKDFSVGLVLRKFPNGGSWSLFRCPQCDGRVQVLWLLDSVPCCRRCCLDRGVRYRIESMGVRRRAEITASKLAARLEGEVPARFCPRPGRVLDRRSRLEAGLARAKFVMAEGWLSEASSRDAEGS
jgi:hypothetical protein